MADTHGGFGFGAYIKEESNEELITQEMVEGPTGEDFEEFVAEVPSPTPEPAVEPKAPAAPVPKYEISKRPMRPRKRR